jgi:DNA processing protein
MEEGLQELILLTQCPGIGPIVLRKLLDHYHTPQNIIHALYKNDPFLSPALKNKLKPYLNSQLPDYKSLLNKHAIHALSITNPSYPKILKEIPNAPIVLYYKGNLGLLNNPSIGIVGSRKITSTSKQAISSIIPQLIPSGCNIVSGLALGVDAAAHKATLEQNGPTIAVLGSGIDEESIHPKSNIQLARQILAANGLIVSEYLPGTRAQKFYFPARNRIIAGLSKGVLVIQATEKSGSLITAQCAVEYNREVFALPGLMHDTSMYGNFKLIQTGAKLIYHVDHILEDLHLPTRHNMKEITLQHPTERSIYELLQIQPMHIDELCERLKIPYNQISAHLTILEINGTIRQLTTNIFTIQ